MFSCRLISKYHPKQISTLEEVRKASLQSRLKAFQHLFVSGHLQNVALCTEYVDNIIKAMDAG